MEQLGLAVVVARGTDQLETRRRRGQLPADDAGAHLERADLTAVLVVVEPAANAQGSVQPDVGLGGAAGGLEAPPLVDERARARPNRRAWRTASCAAQERCLAASSSSRSARHQESGGVAVERSTSSRRPASGSRRSGFRLSVETIRSRVFMGHPEGLGHCGKHSFTRRLCPVSKPALSSTYATLHTFWDTPPGEYPQQ